jgi:hypothetical protein
MAALKCCRRCQHLSRQLLVLLLKLGHAVLGPQCLVAFGFERLFHDEGIAAKPEELVEKRILNMPPAKKHGAIHMDN